MSNAQESDINQAAIERAREGARLLNAGDYRGAIDAFIEAIRLDPRYEDARMLQWQALRLSEKPTRLEVISSLPGTVAKVLVLVVDVLIYALRHAWWVIYDKADGIDRAYGFEDASPPPRFREDLEKRRQQRRLAQERLEALLAPAAEEPQQLAEHSADSDQSKVRPQPTIAIGACPGCGRLPQFASATSCANCGTTIRTRRKLDEGTRQRAAAELVALQDLGIHARALDRNPILRQPVEAFSWIELAKGPIRWIYCSSDETFCCIPDERIQADFPSISIELEPVKSFHLLGRGRVKAARWGLCHFYHNDVKDYSQRVANFLTYDTHATQDPAQGGGPGLRLPVGAPSGTKIPHLDSGPPAHGHAGGPGYSPSAGFGL